MSGQVLREAAVLMRRRAEWANQGPWKREADHTGHFDIVADGTGPLGGDFVSLDAEHIASWHPEVALAVADWLEAKAEQDDKGVCDARPGPCNHCEHDYGNVAALAVATAYLGREWPETNERSAR